jgi:hypothetical protein
MELDSVDITVVLHRELMFLFLSKHLLMPKTEDSTLLVDMERARAERIASPGFHPEDSYLISRPISPAVLVLPPILQT